MDQKRREFIKKAGLITVCGLTGSYALSGCDKQQDTQETVSTSPTPSPTPTPQPKPEASILMSGRIPTRRLGRTNLMVSTLSFGVMENSMSDVWLIQKAIDEGVNYFDTAPDYRWGTTEEALGKAVEGRRDKVIIASKLCRQGTGMMHLPAGIPADEVIRHVEGSLSRLNTDYLDILILHALGENMPAGNYCNGIDCHTNRLNDENMWEAIDRLKQQGKLRFFGVSAHGNNSFPKSLHDSIDTGKVDMMLVAYYYGQGGVVEPVIEHCKEADVGFICMKTLRRGAVHPDYRTGNTPSQAKLRWALANPGVASVCKSIHSDQELEEYIQGVSLQLTQADLELIEADYSGLSRMCHVSCTDCLEFCPHQVPINNILRFNMYFNEYHNVQKDAMAYYNGISTSHNALNCSDCSAPCEKGCSNKVSIKRQLLEAHRNLSMDWHQI